MVTTSVAFNTMMFLMMVRVEDPAGAARHVRHPEHAAVLSQRSDLSHQGVSASGCKLIAYVDPFTYAVDGFKAVLLKDAGFAAIRMDLLYLTVAAMVMITIATALFKRTL